MKLCDYGCGREAKYQFKNGKWCCEKSYNSCPVNRNRISLQNKKEWKNPHSKFNSNLYKERVSNRSIEMWNNPNSIFNSDSYRNKKSNIMKEIWKDPNNIYNSVSCKEKISKGGKLTIEKINNKHPFFSKIEEMRYNPECPKEKEIQVHCKNHECENSKEKDGWFTPTKGQLKDRRDFLENKGEDKSNFYCCQHCKDTCPLYNLRSDPYKDNSKPYTPAELKVFNKHILNRDNEICYYCDKHHATIVHHLRPQKLEPFFALDPDYAISVCAKCHYKYGHPTGSKYSTGNLAKIVCSVESQKFLRQVI